jgi:hypothetical protein
MKYHPSPRVHSIGLISLWEGVHFYRSFLAFIVHCCVNFCPGLEMLKLRFEFQFCQWQVLWSQLLIHLASLDLNFLISETMGCFEHYDIENFKVFLQTGNVFMMWTGALGFHCLIIQCDHVSRSLTKLYLQTFFFKISSFSHLTCYKYLCLDTRL